MNRSFVLLMIAAVLLAVLSMADAADSATKTKSASKSKSKSTSLSKSKSKSVKSSSKTQSKSAVKATKTSTPATNPVPAPAAPVVVSKTQSKSKTATKAAVQTHSYSVNLKLDTTAEAANAAKNTIVAQLKEDLGAKSVTVGTFATKKFTVQAVSASAVVSEATVTATAAKAALGSSTYRLANFKVESVDVITSAPDAASVVTAGWSVLAMILSACLMAVTLF